MQKLHTYTESADAPKSNQRSISRTWITPSTDIGFSCFLEVRLSD